MVNTTSQMLGWPQNQSGQLWKILFPLGFDLWIIQPGVTILSVLSWSTFCICQPDVIVFQLEVLELLVQHGADLNAKTKHEETPAGELLMF
jgi:hypothetical protein